MMNKLLIIFAIVSLASAAIPDDKITTLPGWSGAIPSMYSGYLPTAKTSVKVDAENGYVVSFLISKLNTK